jgi:hypothetical protein
MSLQEAQHLRQSNNLTHYAEQLQNSVIAPFANSVAVFALTFAKAARRRYQETLCHVMHVYRKDTNPPKFPPPRSATLRRRFPQTFVQLII